MSASPNLLPTPTANSPHLLGEGMHDQIPLTYAERATEMELKLNNGHIPTLSEFYEIQTMAKEIQHRPTYDPNEGAVGSRYETPDGREIEPITALTLQAFAQPTRWVQWESDEWLMFQTAQDFKQLEVLDHAQEGQLSGSARRALKRAALPLQTRIGHSLSIISQAVRGLVPDPEGLTVDALDRLAALSHVSRIQLQEDGVDIEAIIRSRVPASATAAVPGRVHFEVMDTDTQEFPAVGTMSASVPVVNQATGEIERTEPMPRGDKALQWLILNDISSSEVPRLARARAMGGSSVYGETIRGMSTTRTMNDEELAETTRLTNQVAALEEMQAAIEPGGAVPSAAEISERLFPGRQGNLTASERMAVDTVVAKFNYITNRAAKVDRYPGLTHRRQDFGRWLVKANRKDAAFERQARQKAEEWYIATKRRFAAFKENLPQTAARAAQAAGMIALSLTLAASNAGVVKVTASSIGRPEPVASRRYDRE
jgi:hypothetical protein